MKVYDNIDEKELLKLFCDRTPSLMPLLKGDKVLSTDGYKVIYVNAAVCEGIYKETCSYNLVFPPVAQELNIPLASLQKAYESLPKELQEDYDSEDCKECEGTGSVEWEYLDKNGKCHHESHDCPICDGDGYFKRNLKMYYAPYQYDTIGIDGFIILNGHIKAIIDALVLLGKDHITLLSKENPGKADWAYFRIDENISIVISPCLTSDEADVNVEL